MHHALLVLVALVVLVLLAYALSPVLAEGVEAIGAGVAAIPWSQWVAPIGFAVWLAVGALIVVGLKLLLGV